MAKQKLFQFAVLYHEKVEKQNQSVDYKTTVLLKPETILGTDEKVVLLQIAKQIPDGYEDKLQDVEILIKPF